MYVLDESVQMVTGNSGILESPNFPQPYENNARKTWVIKAPEGARIKLSILEMEVQTMSLQ